MIAGIHEATNASPSGQHETVTLHMETATPRKRALVSTYQRVRTPPGESRPARRQRKKNEGKARARAACRLNAADHERYKEAERVRKRSAARATSWTAPQIWPMLCDKSSGSEASSSRLHENVQLTPRGSRVHTFEHTSPGGSVRQEEYTSPADTRATREERCGWRSRIAHARMETRMAMQGRVHCYWIDCMHCGTSHRIQPDGCMSQHSIGPSLRSRERDAYRESEAYAEHGDGSVLGVASTMARANQRVTARKRKCNQTKASVY